MHNLFYLCNCKSFFVFMQKQGSVKKRTSLVSISLPVKKIFLVTCLFSVGKKNYCVLPCGYAIIHTKA